MRKLTRAASTALIATAVAATGLATAAPASAAGYRCTTSHKSIDDAAYNGPWPDNWNVTTTICAKRSGSYVYTYAKLSWDGPVYARADDSGLFDGAYFRLQIKRSQSGTDPILTSRAHHGIEARLEDSTSGANYNNSYTTGTLAYRIGSARGLGDGELRLDWNNDGDGYRTHRFSASPVV
ncbi:hypothetical protein ACFSJS_09400 [Streptomyces desertarenae]|uniref:Secreted protein n=1 Tax=Streptomyces desertarenae TaxID=2666184 RepID=A0ABW4PIJ1_9ACTN